MVKCGEMNVRGKCGPHLHTVSRVPAVVTRSADPMAVLPV